MSQKKQVWEQMAGESDVAFEAFRAYRDQSSPRSIRSLVDQLSKSRKLLMDWSNTNRWDDRVRAYTRHKDRVIRAERRQALLKMADDHTSIARSVQSKALTRLRQIDPSLLEPKDVVAFLNLGIKIEREARSYATEDLESLSVEVEAVKQHFNLEKVHDEDSERVISLDDILKLDKQKSPLN